MAGRETYRVHAPSLSQTKLRHWLASHRYSVTSTYGWVSEVHVCSYEKRGSSRCLFLLFYYQSNSQLESLTQAKLPFLFCADWFMLLYFFVKYKTTFNQKTKKGLCISILVTVQVRTLIASVYVYVFHSFKFSSVNNQALYPIQHIYFNCM